MIITFISYGQDKNDDYAILNKIINVNFRNVVNVKMRNKDTVFELRESINFYTKPLENYYNFTFLGKENTITMIIGYNKKKKKPLKLEGKEKEEFDVRWFSIYKVLDSVFTQEDLSHILSQDKEIFWNPKELKENIKFIKNEDVISRYPYYISGNGVSKPLYSIDGKSAIIWCRISIQQPKYYVLIKEKSGWRIVDEIAYGF